MFRHLVSISLVLTLSAVPLSGQETAEDAKEAFDQARQDWAAVVGQLKEKHQQQAQAGDGDGSLAAEIAALDQQSQALVQKIVAAGLQVYEAQPDKYPDVNETLVGIDFVRIALPMMGLSWLVIAIGMGTMVLRGGLNYGIDFAGGTMVHVRFPEAKPISDVRPRLSIRSKRRADGHASPKAWVIVASARSKT